jgi:hypothetical protein
MNTSLRRVIDILWSVFITVALLMLDVHELIWTRISYIAKEQMLQRYLTIPAFLAIYYLCWAILFSPMLVRRRISLLAWLNGFLSEGLMFIIGGSLLMICQILSPQGWREGFEIILLILVLATRYLVAGEPEIIRRLRPARRVLLAIVDWIWLSLGLWLASKFIPSKLLGSPLWIAHLVAWMTAWTGVSVILRNFVATKIPDQIRRFSPWCAGLASNSPGES